MALSLPNVESMVLVTSVEGLKIRGQGEVWGNPTLDSGAQMVQRK